MKIQIPSPCSENWNKMLPVGENNAGCKRYCNSCNKIIYDFTAKSDKEIIEHIKNAGNKICGSFHPSQLNRKLVYSYRLSFKFNKLAAGIIGFFYFSGSAFAQQNKRTDSSGKEMVAPKTD